MTAERWVDVPGWEGAYQVSDAGRVRSVDRVLSDGRSAGGVILAPRQARNGYLVVNLGGHTAGVHRLVLTAFRGTRHRWTQVRHLDGDRTNNQLRNLKWGDQRLNERDKRGGRGRGREKRDRKDEIGEIGRGFPGLLGCFICFPRRRGCAR